ncbi:hypothetical protein F7734_55790 [Scytonema sp. UIC 10036]|uniref:hypothetical protein n=1 Tax=Scytonema sp. UIC 10036 TaxID=2304196 RepID=UPI0012DADBCA|nr:hypothetical protein [Scytonema sp. UIC 10036]MUH01043.1 hypothetical protein [Scytonema sp. UIC 10036]
MMKSMLQLANELGYSHTTVANKVKELETELGRELGTYQGRARMLSPDEQELIRARCPQRQPKEGAIVLRTTQTISKVSAPSLPIIPEIVAEEVDTTEIDTHNDVLDNYSEQLDEALKQALLNSARKDAKALKPQIKAIYKTALIEAKSEVLKENLGAK